MAYRILRGTADCELEVLAESHETAGDAIEWACCDIACDSFGYIVVHEAIATKVQRELCCGAWFLPEN